MDIFTGFHYVEATYEKKSWIVKVRPLIYIYVIIIIIKCIFFRSQFGVVNGTLKELDRVAIFEPADSLDNFDTSMTIYQRSGKNTHTHTYDCFFGEK